MLESILDVFGLITLYDSGSFTFFLDKYAVLLLRFNTAFLSFLARFFLGLFGFILKL